MPSLQSSVALCLPSLHGPCWKPLVLHKGDRPCRTKFHAPAPVDRRRHEQRPGYTCRFCNEPLRILQRFVTSTSEHGMMRTGRRSSPTISMTISLL